LAESPRRWLEVFNLLPLYADCPGKVIAIEAARYSYPAALVLALKFIGLFGSAFGVVEP